MPGRLLTTNSQIQCPHGGQAVLMTTDTAVSAQSGRVLLESDVHVVAGCPFTIGPKPSPCVRIQWQMGASQVAVSSVKPLMTTSLGTCYSPESAPQGLALIVNTQQKASAR